MVNLTGFFLHAHQFCGAAGRPDIEVTVGAIIFIGAPKPFYDYFFRVAT